MNIYHKNNIHCSKITTLNYSTSFSLGIRILNKKYHNPIYAIYGFVRYADEIVDTFFTLNQKQILDEFKKDTFSAIERKFSTNPILDSFQWVVNSFEIDSKFIDAFFYSMEMDLYKKVYSQKEFQLYVYGSAEVVGLMCLKVFCNEKPSLYTQLYQSARKLGEAFQKINFLRDIKSDFIDRGRSYFPDIDINNFTDEMKRKLENEIEQDFYIAEKGIQLLPNGCRKGVKLAYSYYVELLSVIKKISAKELLTKRYRVKDITKLKLYLQSYL